MRAGARAPSSTPCWAGCDDGARLVRVPASSANLGPGFDVLACALGLHVELEVVETGTFGVVTDLRDRPRPPQPRRARLRALAPGRRARVPDPLRRPAVGRPGHERGGDRRRAASPPTRSTSSTPTCSAHATRWRAIRTTSPPRCSAASCCAPTAAPSASTCPPGSRPCSSCRTSRCAPHAARAALPAEVPMADAVFNVAHAGLLVLGLARGDWDLVARGLARPAAPAAPRAPLPALDGARPPRAGARRARRDDLRRRPDRARLVRVRGDGRGRRAARGASARAGRRSATWRSSRAAPTSSRSEARIRARPRRAAASACAASRSGPCARAPRRPARGSRGRGRAGGRGSSGPLGRLGVGDRRRG